MEKSKLNANTLGKSGLVLLTVLALSSSRLSAASLYWDANGTTAGAGTTPTGTWGTSSFWNSDLTGSSGGSFTAATASGDDLFFVAGPSGTSGNAGYTVTVNGVQAANSMTFQSAGAAIVSGGTAINIGAGGITGSQFAFGSTARGAVTISTALVLQATQNFTNNGTNLMTFSGGVTGTGNLVTYANTTGGITLSTAAVNNTGSVINFGGGAGAVTISGGLGSNVTAFTQASSTSAVTVGALALGQNFTITSLGFAATTFNGGVTGAFNLVTSADSTGAITLSTAAINNGGTITNSGAGSGATTISFALGASVTGVTQNSSTSSLTLSGVNSSFTGPINLTAGTLKLGSATALGTGGALNIAAGTTLDASAATTISTVNAQNWNGDFTYGGSFALNTGTGAVSLGSGAGTVRTVTVNANTLTIGGVISNGTTANSLTKAGAGTLVLNGANAFTGSVTVNGGALTLGANNSYAGTTSILNGTLTANTASALGSSSSAILLGDTTGSSNTKLTNGFAGALLRNVVVQAGNTGVATMGGTLSGTFGNSLNTITLGTGTVGHGLTISNNSFQSTTYAAKITDPTVGGMGGTAGLLTIAGTNGTTSAAGQTYITNTGNNYAGGTLLSGGRLGLIGNATLGTGTFVINVGAITVSGTSGGGFTQNASGALASNNAMVWDSDFIYDNTGSSGNNLNLGTGAVSLGNGSQVAGSTRTLYVNSATLTVGGAISNSTSGSTVDSLTKDGGGALILGGASTYTGATTITKGKIQLGASAGNLPATTALTVSAGSVANTAGGLLDLNTRSQTVTSLSGGSGTGSQGLITNGAAATASTLTVDSSTSSQFDGLLVAGGTGALALVKDNTGTLTLTGSNSYSGGTTINGGTLIANGTVTTASAATPTGTGSLNGSTIALSSSAGLVVGQKLTGTSIPAGSFVTNINGNTITISNYLTGNISAATLTFAAYNGSALGSGTVLVQNSATLGGTGTIAGAVTVNGSLAPGSGGIGTLTAANDVTWNGSSGQDWKFELGVTTGSNDQLLLAGSGNDFLKGTGTGGSDFRFDFLNTGVIGTFTLVDWDPLAATTFLASDFSYIGLASGLSATFGLTGSQLDLTVVAVPEPSTYALLGMGLSSLWFLRRKKKV